jgi:hypothetical protein
MPPGSEGADGRFFLCIVTLKLHTLTSQDSHQLGGDEQPVERYVGNFNPEIPAEKSLDFNLMY